MSRQQSRSPGDGAIDPSLAQKKRARHRLVGAICLCLLAAVVVPLVLESEPQPSRDLPLELAAAPGATASQEEAHPGQSRNDSGSPSASGAIAPRADGPAAPAGEGTTSLSTVTTVTSPAGTEPAQPPVALAPPSPESAQPRSEPSRAESRPDVRGQRADGGSAAAKPEGGRDAAKAAPAPQVARPAAGPASGAGASASSKAAGGGAAKEPARPSRSDDGPDVIARLIERADSKATAGAAPAVQRKFLVQIGAYSNVQSARNMSDRAVQAGLRPYQETVKTAQGDWIRVRVGPFPTRQDAERAQQDLKRAGVTAAIIAL